MFVSKRKYGRLPLLLGSVITYFLIPTAFGQIFHLPSQMPVGNSDMNGFARLDREFYEMPLGNDQSTRLFFRFSTDPRQEPKYMGAYWSIPFSIRKFPKRQTINTAGLPPICKPILSTKYKNQTRDTKKHIYSTPMGAGNFI